MTLTHSSIRQNAARVNGSKLTGFPYEGSDGGGGIYANDGPIKASASTLDHNSATVSAYYGGHGGGALYEDGPFGSDVTLSHTKLVDNSFTLHGTRTDLVNPPNCCSGGGAVYLNTYATVSITRGVLTGNKVTIHSGSFSHGGGAGNVDVFPAPLTINRSTISHNTASVHGPKGKSASGGHCCSGGGAISTTGVLQLIDSTLDANTSDVTAGDCCQGGGAVNFDGTGGQQTVRGSTISHNRSLVSAIAIYSGGGGVYADVSAAPSPVLSYTNSTISGNTTDAAAQVGGGGGLYLLYPQPTLLANTTLAGNSASSGAGGGILNAGSTLQSKNSIVALNTAKRRANCAGFNTTAGGQLSFSAAPIFTSLGFNLTNSPDTCNFTGTGDKVVQASAVKLGPLANNGGPTLTRALLKGSPAIDHGNPAGCTDPMGVALTTDQRGRPRPDHGETVCDIGAYEFQDK